MLTADTYTSVLLELLPLRVESAQHRRREDRACSCLAVAFADRVGTDRVVLSVSPSTVAVWRKGSTGFDLVHRQGLGGLRAVSFLQQAFGILSRSRRTITVDNLPIPAGRRHRLRLVFADHSSAVVVAPGRYNARQFVERVGRLRDDVELIALSALAGSDGMTPAELAERTGLRPATLDAVVTGSAGPGRVHVDPAGISLTVPGASTLVERANYVQELSRFVRRNPAHY